MVLFHSYVSLPEGISWDDDIWRFPFWKVGVSPNHATVDTIETYWNLWWWLGILHGLGNPFFCFYKVRQASVRAKLMHITSLTFGLMGNTTIAGWWFGTVFIFPYIVILGIIIPTDFHIFQRDRIHGGFVTNERRWGVSPYREILWIFHSFHCGQGMLCPEGRPAVS